jgi:nucleotide-binding universal stress UspA family protein
VAYQPNSNRAELSRLLVAADLSIDAHRLVRVCCERSGRDPLGVSLLVAVDDMSAGSSEAPAQAERLLRKAAALLEAAGIRLEEGVLTGEDDQRIGQLVRSGGFDALLICAASDEVSSPVLPHAAHLARLHGLTVVGNGLRAGTQAGWLRRAIQSLLR